MKRWIHANEDTAKGRSVVFLLFDVCIDDETDDIVQEVAAANNKKRSKRDKTVEQILTNPKPFLNDFGSYVKSLGFDLLSDTYKSKDKESISCYFYAKMTKDFGAGRHELDMVTVFCIRTSDHRLDLEEFKNEIQNRWMKEHASELTGDVNQAIKVFRIVVSSNRSYSDYVASCKKTFKEYCDFYSNWGKWPDDAFERVKL